MKRNILFLALVVIFSLPMFSHASGTLVISEIFYDASGSDADHEWIEVHNVSSSPVTIVGGSGSDSWRFNDSSNHYLAENATKGVMTIPTGGYAIIAGNADTFLSDHSGFSGTVIDTSMSLPNTSGTVKIVDGTGNIVDTATYSNSTGGAGDGNSLQLSSDGKWISGTPTPGSGTAGGTVTDTTGGTGTTGGSGGGSTPVPVTKAPEAPPQPRAVLSVDPGGVAGIPINISAKVYGSAGEMRQYGVFYFALGDGTIKEESYLEPFKHTYKFPGTYVVSFFYKNNVYIKEPELKARQVVEIVAPTVYISGVSKDGTIEIKNPADNEEDVSDWSVVSEGGGQKEIFKIPAGTFILPGKTMLLPTEVTGFVTVDISSIKLLLPSGEAVSVEVKKPKIVSSTNNSKSETILPGGNTSNDNLDVKNNEEVIPLTANALLGASPKEVNSSEPKKIPMLVFLLIGIIGLVGASVVAYRNKNNFFTKFTKEGKLPLTETEKIANSINIIEE